MEKTYLAYIVEFPKKIEVKTVNKKGLLQSIEMTKEEFRDWVNSFPPKRSFLLKKVENSKNLILKVAQIAITEKCNLKCRHCYLVPDSSSLSFSFFKMLADSFAELGIRIIEYSGGEPLLHKDFFKMIRYGREKGFYQKLLTNGVLIDEKKAKRLTKYLDAIRISIDGPERLHEKVRRVKGCFKKAKRAIEILKKFKGKEEFDLEIGMSILTLTRVKDIYQLYSEFKDKVDCIFISPVVPAGRSKKITPFELKELYERFLDFLSISEVDKNKIRRKTKSLFFCDGGKNLIYVSASKEVYPCPLLIDKKLKITTLEESGSLVAQFRDSLKKFNEKSLWREKLQRYSRACKDCKEGCFYPCPAYRYHLRLVKNPWCYSQSNFRIFNYPEYFELLKQAKGSREREVEIVLSILDKFANSFQKLIDLGCGDGEFLHLLSKRMNSKTLVGIDKSTSLIQKAKNSYPLLNFENLDCTDGNFPSRILQKYGKFDVAINIWTSILGYEGGRKDKEFLANIYLLLKKGGILIIDTNNLDFLKKNFKERSKSKITKGDRTYWLVEERKWSRPDTILTFFDIYQNKKLKFSTSWEIKFYEPEELKNMLSFAGFEIIDCTTNGRIVIVAKKL